MNILSASLSRANGDMRFDFGGTGFPISGEPERALAKLEREEQVSTGIRPSDFSVYTVRPQEPSFESEVVVFEPLGHYGVLTAQCSGSELKVKVDKGVRPDIGTRIWLVPSSDRYYFFNPRTGESLLF